MSAMRCVLPYTYNTHGWNVSGNDRDIKYKTTQVI